MSENQCYFCGSSLKRVFSRTDRGEIAYFQCRKCGLVWLEEEAKARHAAEYYRHAYNVENYRGLKNPAAVFANRFHFINKYFPKPGRVLEIGSSSGDFLKVLKDRGWEVRGVDLSKRAVEQAKTIYNFNFFNGTVEEAGFKNNSFDLVVMCHVLEHVSDPRTILKEIQRILIKEGILLLEVPNPSGFDARVSKRVREGSILRYPNHLYLFPPRLLNQLIKEADFDILEREISLSFLVVNFFKRPFAFQHKSTGLKSEEITVNKNKEFSSEPPQRLPPRRFKNSALVKFFRCIFPGMNIMVVARKP